MDKEILYKHFKGELSEQEERELFDWVEQAESNKKEYLKEREVWNILLLNKPEIRVAETGSRSRYIVTWRVAAIAAVFVGIVIVGSFLLNAPKQEPVTWNTIEIPIGQRARLILSDGTEVWLNAKSRFKFPNHFRDNKREVILDGEAAFDVAHNSKSPFVVKTRRFNVNVLGTKFNVYAYNNSPVFETTLIRGKVSLEGFSKNPNPVLLAPNQMAVYDSLQDRIKVKNVDARACLYWTEGIYSFDNEPLSDIIQRLERYYEVKIIVKNPEILKNTFTGKFRYSDSVEVILEVVKWSKYFRYYKKGNEITIY